MGSVKSVLKSVHAYIALQRLVGADLVRYRGIAELALEPNDVVIDVGCGPAYYLDRLPTPVRYDGFDTDRHYIDWSTKKFGDRATFHHGIFDEAAARPLPAPDAIMLLGLLHHLSDEDCRNLLELSARVLAPGGRVVSVDTAFISGQGRLSRWMAKNDRGEFVRKSDRFIELARSSFEDVNGHVVAGRRILGSHWLMRMAGPREASTRIRG